MYLTPMDLAPGDCPWRSPRARPSQRASGIRFPAVAGQTYFLRVGGNPLGAPINASPAINVYNLSVINTPAPIPYDLELVDILSTATVAIAGGANQFSALTVQLQNALGTTDPGLGPDVTVANYFAGKFVHFVNGTANGQRSRIVTSTLAGPNIQFTVDAPFTPAPAVGNAFFIESFDTGFSQFDDMTRDNTPVILIRLEDANIGLTFNPQQTATPTLTGYRVAIFDEGAPQQPGSAPQVPIGYARRLLYAIDPAAPTVVPGVYIFDFERDGIGAAAWAPVAFPLTDGSHFISAKVEITDPATPLQTGFGDRSLSLEAVIDTAAPPAFFGSPNSATDGLHPDSDSGVDPATFSDSITNDATPTFWGQAEANAEIRIWLDTNDNGTIEPATDILIAQTQADPLAGTNQYPNGHWEAPASSTSTRPKCSRHWDRRTSMGRGSSY